MTMDFMRADIGIFKDLFSKEAWDKTLEGKGAQESCLILKDYFLRLKRGPSQQKGNVRGGPEEIYTNDQRAGTLS